MAQPFRMLGGAVWAASFGYRDFRYLWLSSVFQSVGMGMEFVALGWLVLDMTGSPLIVGVATGARMAPFFFLGQVSGAVADRVDRRVATRWATAAGALIAAIIALALFSGYANVWHIVALSVCTGGVFVFGMTLRQAYTYDIVGPQSALNGMSLSALSQRLGSVPGSLAAGLIIQWFGIESLYAVIALSYLASLATLLPTRDAGQSATRTPQSALQNLIAYVQILRDNGILLTLMILAAVTELFGFTHQTLLPVLAKDDLGVEAGGLGMLSAFQQMGGVVGLVALSALGDFRRKGLLAFIVAAGFGVGEMAFSIGGGYAIARFALTLAFVNACAAAVDTLYRTLMQDNVSNEQRGRAMGAWAMSIGVAPVGHLGVGALADAYGAPRALLINGAVLFGVSVAAALALPRVRRLR